MAFGYPQYAENNILLNRKFAENRVLICAHRGSSHGNVIQNTTMAYKAAIMQGADIVEADTTASTDHVVFTFHDGVEKHLLGCEINATEMTAEQIQSFRPINAVGEPGASRIQKLDDVLAFLCHDELINIDRIWRAHGLVLPILDRHPHMARQAILKAPLKYRVFIEELSRHPVKYMFMPICHSREDIEEALKYDNLNLVGVELIAETQDHELFSEDVIRFAHSKNLFCWVNALSLYERGFKPDLYGGIDDDLSILEGPEYGWGRLIDMGIDVIQTDWPALVKNFRAKKLKLTV